MTLFLILAFALIVCSSSSHDDCSGVIAIYTSEITEVVEEYDSISKNISNNSEVRFCSNHGVLDQVIRIENLNNISITGVISCSNDAPAGLSFANIHSLSLTGLVVSNCAHLFSIDFGNKSINASISIQNSINIIISDITISRSSGTGLALFDILGYSTIKDSTFRDNGRENQTGGNGLYMEISSKGSNMSFPINFEILRCHFINNSAGTEREENIPGFNYFSKGGGLCIFISGVEKVIIIIENATFSGNKATSFGGGTYAQFQNDASNSSITIKGSYYTNNYARYGGGHHSGYWHDQVRKLTLSNCNFIFQQNIYTNNIAHYGGGVSVFATKSYVGEPQCGRVTFKNCTWRLNSGHYGTAIAILPNAWNMHTDGNFPEILFSDTVIDSNFVTDRLDQDGKLIKQYTNGYGALYCSNYRLTFKNLTSVKNNSKSAFCLESCTVTFSEDSRTDFSNNSGYYGGGMYMLSSVLYLSDNIRFVFKNNSAYSMGGAIYYNAFTFHAYDYSRTCFLAFALSDGKKAHERNITFLFANNTAGTKSQGYGHSVYADSLMPCYRQFQFHINNVSFDMFSQIGNFTYSPLNRERELATASSSSKINDELNKELLVISGKMRDIPFTDKDDFGQQSESLYLVTVFNDENSNIEVDAAYAYISSPHIKLIGSINNQATIVLSAQASRFRALEFRVKIIPCPPGYILNEVQVCECAHSTANKYTGISYCNSKKWRARRISSYWIGYEENKTESEDSLLTGYCPSNFCSSNVSLLPTTADREKLNKVMCGDKKRTGTLCGNCEADHSVYYHSLQLKCNLNNYCHFGWLFYILSELLPVTLIFLIIIFFGITFTSGILNGFIFYAQVVVMFHITADNHIRVHEKLKTTNSIIHSLYHIFSLNTFALENMSFCLFKEAGALDIIAFSYITLIYSLILIIGVILVMNKLNLRYCCKPCGKYLGSQWRTLESSIIHGLTAFLVLCYANCARASFLLLTHANIRTKGGVHKYYAVYYNGSLSWLSKEHLLYAIPAIIMSFIFVVSTPVLLLIYPIHYRVLSSLRISERKCVRVFFNPLEKLKPLLDSFQSCYKDKYRFFSGLYFLYRFFIFLNVTLNSYHNAYAIISAQLLVMVILTAACQPYKKKLHNLIDTLLFGNLTAINLITTYNYSNAKSNDMNTTNALALIQNILIALPLLVMFCALLGKVILNKKMMLKVKQKTKEGNLLYAEEDDEFPARLVSELNDLSLSSSYRRLHK